MEDIENEIFIFIIALGFGNPMLSRYYRLACIYAYQETLVISPHLLQTLATYSFPHQSEEIDALKIASDPLNH